MSETKQPPTPLPLNPERQASITTLKTARGQIDGIIRMIEDGRYCIDVANQILAVQSLLKKSNKLILSQHLHGCVLAALENHNHAEAEQKTNEILSIIGKLLDTE